MKNHYKFRAYVEAKEQGLADQKVPARGKDRPPESKVPQWLKAGEGLAGGGDYAGDLATRPKSKEAPLPYKGQPDRNTRSYDGKDKEGLAFKGTPGVTAKTSAEGEEPDLKVKASQSKGKLAEGFRSILLEGDEPLPTVTDLYGNQFTPNPTETIEYMAALMTKNPRLLSRFVREMKRQDGGMKLMVDEQQSHPEFFSSIVEGMSAPETGRKMCHRMARAMNETHMNALDRYVLENLKEEVTPKNDVPFESGGPIGSGPSNPSGMAPKPPVIPRGGPFGGGGMNAPQPSLPPSAFGGGDPGPQAAPPPRPFSGPDAGMPGAGSDAVPPMPGGIGGGPPPMPPGPGAGPAPPPAGFDDGSGQQQPGGKVFPKLKGETAHGNMIEEMGGFPIMFDAMSSHCLNCQKNNK